MLWTIGTLVLMAFIPFKTTHRTLTSDADRVQLQLPGAVPIPTAPVTHLKLMISADMADTAALSNSVNLSPKHLKAYPYRYPDKLSIAMATYQRVNQCTITMIIDEKVISKPVHCEDVADNSLVSFSFDDRIMPGLHQVAIKWEGVSGNEMAIYVEQKANGERWVNAYSAPQTVLLAELFWSWLHRKLTLNLIYLLCLITAVASFFKPTKYVFITLLLALYVGMFCINAPYSGFDETAHIDMLHKTLTGAEDAQRTQFWDEVRADMIQSEFHRLHNVSLQREHQCPHAILGSCGITDGPQVLYRGYKALIDFFIPLDWRQSPVELRKIMLGINTGLLLALLLLIRLFSHGLLTQSFLILLVFYGGLLAQMPSITNDVPLVLLGVFLTFVEVLALLPGTKTSVRYLLYFLGWIFVVMLLRVDRSALASFPVLLMIPCLWLIQCNKPMSSQEPAHTQYRESVVWTAIFGVLLCVTFIISKAMILSDAFGIQSFIVSNIPSGSFITNLQKFSSDLLSFKFIARYIKSIFGSFVWGHSYYHTITYLMLAIGGLVCLFYGIMWTVGNIKRTHHRMIFLVILAIQGSALFLLVLSAYLADSNAAEIVRDSYLKSRFTAPGLVPLFVLPILGLYQLLQNPRGSLFLTKATNIWVLCLLSYYLPKFFLSDIY